MEVFFRVSLREHENVILKEKYILYSKKFGFTKQVLVFPINFQMEYFNFVSLCSLCTQSKIGYAVVSKSQGLKLAKDGLVGRVYDVCLDDLKEDESAHRKVKLIAEDVKERDLLTNFHGTPRPVASLGWVGHPSYLGKPLTRAPGLFIPGAR